MTRATVPRRVRRARVWVITAVVLLVMFGGRPSPAIADDVPVGEPVQLPSLTEACVPAAPTRSVTPSWAQEFLSPQRAWPLTRGSGVVVAVLDTGVSPAAAALTGAVVSGVDMLTGGSATGDCQGRGTALAAIVAGRPVTGSPFVGVAPAATVFPIRVTDGSGRLGDNSIASGIVAAVNAGADIVLVGTGVGHSAALQQAVTVAVQAGVLVVAPVNPNGGDSVQERMEPPWYPAAYDPVLAVGGVNADGTGTWVGADILAPSTAYSVGPTGNGHYLVGGTPVAAAFVAGTAALVAAYHPSSGQASWRSRLLDTARRQDGRPPILDGYRSVSGVDVAPARSAPPVDSFVAVPARATSPDTSTAALLLLASILIGVTAAAVAFVIRRGRHRNWTPN